MESTNKKHKFLTSDRRLRVDGIYKKGMEMGMLASILILLVVGLVLLSFFKTSGEKSGAHDIEQQCRANVEVNAIGRIGGVPLYDEFLCPTEYLELEESDTETLKKKAADAMASCWYRMGAGEYEVFDTALLSPTLERTTQYCVVCSVLEFQGSPGKIENFLSYLDKNSASVLYTRGEIKSYTEYLQGFRSDPNLQLLYEEETADTINTATDYATIFLYAKRGYLDKVWTATGGALLGAVSGIVGGALIIGGITAPAGVGVIAAGVGAGAGYLAGSETSADWESGILLYPYTTEELKKLNCDILPAKQQ